ncbi:MAG: cupin domain-containing protein [Alphaproteobacteria bacterium]
MTMTKPRTTCALIAIAMAPALLASTSMRAEDAHAVIVTPDKVTWSPGPPSLPEGAEMMLLEGHPAEDGPLTLRLKFPAGYEIPAHVHPEIEHVTVLSGRFNAGMGEELDKAGSVELPPGAFVVIPPDMAHFAWASEETVIQLHSNGLWGITYIDPSDDPRKTD